MHVRSSLGLRFGVLAAGVFAAGVWLRAPAQDGPGNDALVRAVGLPVRAAPSDYQATAKAGMVTIAADFMGHGIPTADAGPFTTEDYVSVEVALFGAPDARLKMSYQDFSLRFNGKKMPTPSESYVLVFKSLKDPDWEPTAADAGKGKTNITTGGGGGNDDPPPPPPKMPLELRRAMNQRVQKASLPEGDRTLPQAGLLFFEYRVPTKSIKSMELIYDGPAGKATMALKP